MRLGGQQPVAQVGGLVAAARAPAQRGAVGNLALTGQQVMRLALERLAMREPERFGTRALPSARRLSPALAGLNVITGCILGRVAVNLLPDLLQVVPLAQRRRHDRGAAALAGKRLPDFTAHQVTR